MDVTDLLLRRRELMMGGVKSKVLPVDYTSIEYVQCPYTKAFTTDVIAEGTQWDFDIENINSSNVMFVAYRVNAGCYAGIQSGKYWLGGGVMSSSSCLGRQNPKVTFMSNKVVLDVNGETKERGPGGYGNNRVQLFQLDGSYKYNGKVYSVKCNDGALFDGVPAMRISDNANGIYDFVSGNFYPV